MCINSICGQWDNKGTSAGLMEPAGLMRGVVAILTANNFLPEATKWHQPLKYFNLTYYLKSEVAQKSFINNDTIQF